MSSHLNLPSNNNNNNNNPNDSIFIKQQRNIQRRHVQDLELRFTKQIFHEFDADGSDSIDIEELRLVMEAMGHEMTQNQLVELLEQVDINKSGDLSFSEFVQLIALWKAASQFKLFESDSPTIQDQRIQEALEPKLLLSDSWYRMAWDGLVYLVILYSFFFISYTLVTLDIADDTISSVLISNTMEVDIAVSIIWLVDIVIGFFTAQRVSVDNPSDRRVLDTFGEVASYHLSRVYFYIDLFALLPLHRMVGDNSSLVWIGFNTAFRIFKAPRLFQRSQRMQLSATYVYVHFYLVPLSHALVSALFFIHLLSCFWTLVQRAAQAEGAPLFAGQFDNSTSDSKSSNADVSVNYVTSLYFILAVITTTGFGDVYILENNFRVVAACILCVIGTLVTGIVIGNIVTTLSKTNIHTDRENKLVQTLAVLNYFSVPGPLANEILNFQNHLLLHNLGDSHRGLIRGLPEEMQKNISLFSRINLVSECVLFSNAHQGTKVALAEAIKPMVFRPDENVVVQGEVGDCMYFVSYGVLGMKMAKNDIFFQRGNYFGEIALLCRGATRTATIKALTYCDLFQLTRDVFRGILARFPKFRVAISEVCQTRKKELLQSFENEGDQASYDRINKLKFIHEEEAERAAALLEAANLKQQQQQQLSQANMSSADFANTNSSGSGNHQNQPLANESSSDLAVNNNNNSGSGNNDQQPNQIQRRAGSNESPSGETDSPETGVRSDIKSCSTLLTDLHAMVHSMTHGFEYTGPSEIPNFIHHQQAEQSGSSSRGTSFTTSSREQQQQQQSSSLLSPQHRLIPSTRSTGQTSSPSRENSQNQQQNRSSSSSPQQQQE